jgi:predicted lactoylglutathione lyase
MLVRNIEDLDGHQWAIMFLDTNKFKKLRKNKEA